jgi:hypothetical protein
VCPLAAARHAPAPVRVGALAPEHRPGAEAERLARLRADHAVDGQSVPALVALHRALGLRPEDAVRRDAERALKPANLVLRLRRVGAHAGPLCARLGGGERGARGQQGRQGERQHGRHGGGLHRLGLLAGLRHVV